MQEFVNFPKIRFQKGTMRQVRQLKVLSTMHEIPMNEHDFMPRRLSFDPYLDSSLSEA